MDRGHGFVAVHLCKFGETMLKFIVGSVPFLFILSLAGSAAARRPPALTERQERAERVYAACAERQPGVSTAYRDMHSRSSIPRTDGSNLAVPAPLQRKMGDHLVLICKSGEIHLGSGYRGFPARLLPVDTAAVQVATVSKPSRIR